VCSRERFAFRSIEVRTINPRFSAASGHTSIAITLDLYSHVIPTMQRDAVAVPDAVLGGRA